MTVKEDQFLDFIPLTFSICSCKLLLFRRHTQSELKYPNVCVLVMSASQLTSGESCHVARWHKYTRIFTAFQQHDCLEKYNYTGCIGCHLTSDPLPFPQHSCDWLWPTVSCFYSDGDTFLIGQTLWELIVFNSVKCSSFVFPCATALWSDAFM